ncbi:MAG: heme biosynthesis protein HemY [Neomegalonema sp.]
MLSLIIRIGVWIAVLGALLLAARWLSGLEGQTVIEIAGYRIGGPTVLILGLFIALFAVVWLIIAALRGTLGSFSDFFGFLARRRHQRGLEAMSKSLIAVAEGDGRTALRHAENAERLLEDPTLTRLLSAQAAKLAGDNVRAERLFEEMLEADETRFLGLRGLLKQALEQDKTERALRFAERAHTARPKDPEVLGIMFDLQRDKGHWAAAKQTVASGVKARQLTKDVSDRRLAVLNLSDAIDQERAGKSSEALKSALEAVRLAPGLSPAAAVAARLLRASGEERKASRILINAWRQSPNPELAREFARLVADEKPMDRLVRFEKLFAAKPGDTETRLLQAELALEAEKYDLAREALGDLPETAPTARACAMMAAIEQGQANDETVVRAWLSKAAAAPRGAEWTCGACGAVSDVWRSTCRSCGAFDTLSWRTAPGRERVENGPMLATLQRLERASAPKLSSPDAAATEDDAQEAQDGGSPAGAHRLIERR